MSVTLLSWNVNGLRALAAKPELTWLFGNGADILALQETKASPEQIDKRLREPVGWHASFDSCTLRKGYSGVAVYSRIRPISVSRELPDARWQGEGRLLHLEFTHFHLLNGYFPNGGAMLEDENGRPTGRFRRLPYKLGFFDCFLEYVASLRRAKPVVICGDFNIAHHPQDLARPDENAGQTGFLPEERAVLDRLEGMGFLDTFRLLNGAGNGHYTWWSYRARARPRNIGWRLDYFWVSEELARHVRRAWIEKDIAGSDHCPVGLELDFDEA